MLALELKKLNRKVTILSRDALMGVLCKEWNIPYHYIEKVIDLSSPALPSPTGPPIKYEMPTKETEGEKK